MILLIVSFVAGALSVLAPCVLPLLPVILAGSMTETTNRKRPIIIIASLSVSVFIFTLILKGSTALISTSPSFWNYISAIILLAFGLTLIFPETWARIVLKIPGHNKPDKWIMKGYSSGTDSAGGKDGAVANRSSILTDIIVGAALGPVFTTCSPTFFVILATVLPQSLAMGMIDLAAYILGLALVLLLVAFIGQKLINHLGWATNPNGWFRKILGILFIVVAICIAVGLDKVIEAKILNSGFFDVTTIEQSIHQSLQGSTALPSSLNGTSDNFKASTGSDCAPGQICSVNGGGNGASSSVASSSSSGNPNSYANHNNSNNSDLNANAAKLPPPPTESNEGRYVEIKDPAGFINSPSGDNAPSNAPFKLADFIGKKVILVDFIDYSCINCERTFPALNMWWSKYASQGLEIVAIHTPEFAFEKDIANVTAAAKQYGLQFPIVLDNDYATWNAYGNEYWPHKYFIDIHGNVVYDYVGEGNEPVLESEIVKLLNDRMTYLGESGSVSTGTSTATDYSIRAESPETYFGAMRNEYFGNGAPFVQGDNSYTAPALSSPNSLTPNQFYLGGKWHIDKEYAETRSASSSISYTFTASKAYIILTTADGKPADATVLIDGSPIKPNQVGVDDKDGIIRIDSSRLYNFYADPNGVAGRHRVDIIFGRSGIEAYTFTFG